MESPCVGEGAEARPRLVCGCAEEGEDEGEFVYFVLALEERFEG